VSENGREIVLQLVQTHAEEQERQSACGMERQIACGQER
jgi:hypothetical protein